jgi:hypothetical protein
MLEMKHRLFILFLSVALTHNTYAQSWNKDTSNDLNTVNGIIHSLYNAISGSSGQDRDWSSFRTLFAENARMYIAVPNKDNNTSLRCITPAEYIERNKTRLADIGFNETELYRITNSYGAGTQILSTYETHFLNKNGEQEITQGINNIQLYFDGQRYYIVSIFWDGNAKNIQVPDRYLPKNKNTEYQIDL